MKKILLSLSVLFIFASCSNENTSNNAINMEEERVENIGGDKDEHGCLIAAGETWSQIKENCIQVFNEGIRLNPITEDNDEAIISAFVIINDNNTLAELFIANEEHSLLLDAKDGGVFEFLNYAYHSDDGVLYISGEKAYAVD